MGPRRFRRSWYLGALLGASSIIETMQIASVFMDVEDPVNPFADDAALQLAQLFTGEGVRGSFCLTGEKCRTLKARGRFDVAEAYRPHCLGLHTDTHSYHPTTMELLADLPFDEGCEAAYAAEKREFEAFTDLFGRPPVFWGGADTWSPEITDALKRLGIGAYVYAQTSLPDEAVHRFNGVLGLPQALSIGEPDWAVDERAESESYRVLKQLQVIGQPWIGVFVGHPTKFRHKDYWDTPYFAGRTPPGPEYVEPLPEATFERSKSNLRSFLRKLQKEAKIVGVDDALAVPWKFASPTETELAYFREHTPPRLRGSAKWGVHYPGLDPELIVAKTMALEGTLEVASVA